MKKKIKTHKNAFSKMTQKKALKLPLFLTRVRIKKQQFEDHYSEVEL